MKPAFRFGGVLAAALAGELLVRRLGAGPLAVAPLVALTALPGYGIAVWAGASAPAFLAPALGIVLLSAFVRAGEWTGAPAAAGLVAFVLTGAAAWAVRGQSRQPASGEPTDARGSARLTILEVAVLGLALAIGILAAARIYPGLSPESQFLAPAGRAVAAVCGLPADRLLPRLHALLAPAALLLLTALGRRLFASTAAGLLALLLGLLHLGVFSGTFAGVLGLCDPCGLASYVLVPLAILLILPTTDPERPLPIPLWLPALFCLFALARIQPLAILPPLLGLFAVALIGASAEARASALRGLLLLALATLLARVSPQSPEPHVHFSLTGAKLESIAPGVFYVDPFGAVAHLYLAEIDQGWAIGLASVLLLPVIVVSRRRTPVGPGLLCGILLGPLFTLLLQPFLAARVHATLTEARTCRFFEWAGAAAIVAAAGGAGIVALAAWERLRSLASPGVSGDRRVDEPLDGDGAATERRHARRDAVPEASADSLPPRLRSSRPRAPVDPDRG